MSTFTKEQLIEKLQHRISVASGFPESEKAQMDLELARIALASLEAEPVGFIVRNKKTGKFGSWMHSKADWFKDEGYEVLSAYIAPPAPVSMKDHQIRELVNELRDIAVQYHGTQQLRERIARTIRAAMLQGADGNSPVIPDGWVMLPAEPTQAMMNAWLSEVANWRGHAAGYRAMIAAAPQQEVKP